MSSSATDPKTAVRAFLLENYLFSDDESLLNDTVSFLEQGLLDSTGILELVMFLEETFDIKIEDSEMVPDNLDCVDATVAFLDRKRAQPT
ncbi:MAG: acyl carrier protein [Pseudomonadota bacterium]